MGEKGRGHRQGLQRDCPWPAGAQTLGRPCPSPRNKEVSGTLNLASKFIGKHLHETRVISRNCLRLVSGPRSNLSPLHPQALTRHGVPSERPRPHHAPLVEHLPSSREKAQVCSLPAGGPALSTSQREDPPGLQRCGRSPAPAARTGPGCRCLGAASRPPPWQQGPKKPRLSAGPPAAPADTEQNHVSIDSAEGVCPVLPGPRGGAPADKGVACGCAVWTCTAGPGCSTATASHLPQTSKCWMLRGAFRPYRKKYPKSELNAGMWPRASLRWNRS